MSLRTYRSKRDFRQTPEPDGTSRPPEPQGPPGAGVRPGRQRGPGGRFVVQRHRARRLHYDVRLELGGVLVSWAVPRGPSLDPAARRLAVQVEDHPLGYFDFEGVIPAGQYGGGDVIVWDWGRWTPDPDQAPPADALAAGELKLHLEGEKLHGGFVLVRTDAWRKSRPDKRKWLLLHRRDEAAISGWDAEDHPASVKTGRTNDDVAARRGRRRATEPVASASRA